MNVITRSCIIPIALPYSIQEKGVEKSRHFRAAVFFVTAVGYVDVLLLATWDLGDLAGWGRYSLDFNELVANGENHFLKHGSLVYPLVI